MKNPLCFIFALLFALAFAGCPDDGSKGGEEPLVLDERLVGGKWFQLGWNQAERVYRLTENKYNGMFATGYYEFLISGDETLFFSVNTNLNKIYADDNLDSIGTDVYSRDGTIYWKHNNQKLMSYEFPNTFPYPNVNENGQSYGLSTEDRYTLNRAATAGDLIIYRLYNKDGSLYGNGTDPRYALFYGYLLRATEYRDY
jgi:hypothetical protein